MSKAKNDALMNAMGSHRPRVAVEADVASTVFGKMAEESKASTEILVASIKNSPYQSRGEIDELHIESLMASISEGGLLSPIIVRVSNLDTFELIAGHNRTEAFRRLGRTMIPAIVRHMSDIEAARALTVENTHKKQLTDWELYKHMKMLRASNFVKSVVDLAGILGCSRTHVYKLEAFEALPPEVLPFLDAKPSLIGGFLAAELLPHSGKHPQLVVEAITLLAKAKIKQAGVVGWIQRKIEKPPIPYRKEIELKRGNKLIKMVFSESDVKFSGDVDFEKLRNLIDANFDLVVKDQRTEEA